MDTFSVGNFCKGNLEPVKGFPDEELSYNGKGLQELQGTMKILSRLDIDVAYSSEKLTNLHALSMKLLALDCDIQNSITDYSCILPDGMEKALVFDLLSGILEVEVREVETVVNTLQMELVDAHRNVSSCRYLREIFTIMEEKLHDSQESLNQSQEQVIEVKIQLAKLQKAFAACAGKCGLNDGVVSQLLDISARKSFQMDNKRQILKMLEKSLARELDLEKKISELQQNEEQLKLKLYYTEQIAFHMEEAAEVVWGRFLEAENSAEVLMGVSKELLNRLQVVHYNFNGSLHREAETQSKLQDCQEKLKENSNAGHLALDAEVVTLREKVKLLEEELRETERKLETATASSKASHEQLMEMEKLVETLKESNVFAETRALNAEAKITQLTETNLELTEEINYLKGSDNNGDKMSLLEKQVRDLEIQLQHAKASAEASQEQQNMLYSAIWDMENLIEDLKSKVTKAENKTDVAEEQCILLSETNFELNQEINFLKTKLETLEASLDQAKCEKVASSKEINVRANLIIEMVRQLAMERERIQNEMYSLTKENKFLKKLLHSRDASDGVNDENGGEEHTPEKTSENPLSNNTQVAEKSKDHLGCETSMNEDVKKEKAWHLNVANILMAVLVALFLGLAIHLYSRKPMLNHR